MGLGLTQLQNSDWDWLVLQEVNETCWHFQLVDAMDLVDLFEVTSDSESALGCQGLWISWRRQEESYCLTASSNKM